MKKKAATDRMTKALAPRRRPATTGRCSNRASLFFVIFVPWWWIF